MQTLYLLDRLYLFQMYTDRNVLLTEQNKIMMGKLKKIYKKFTHEVRI